MQSYTFMGNKCNVNTKFNDLKQYKFSLVERGFFHFFFTSLVLGCAKVWTIYCVAK